MDAASQTDTVPVIDTSRLFEPDTLQEIDMACREWGFFQVIHHGIEDEVIEALHREMRSFFSLPLEAKRRVERSAENPWGFYDRELTKNTRDWKQIFDCGPEEDTALPTPWPAEASPFRSAVRKYAASCEDLAIRLLSAISLNLGMPADHLVSGFRPQHSSFQRLNYYPLCPTPSQPQGISTPSDGHLGVNHHTDAGALTLLVQDEQPGLEVYRGGSWHSVEARPDALVINIGDIVQVWSNDRYHAALHRVKASTSHARFSAPFFFNPAYDMTYAPLPTTFDSRSSGPCYRPIRWGEFRALRAAGDYADYGSEVQISDYRIDDNSPNKTSDNHHHNNNKEEPQHGIH